MNTIIIVSSYYENIIHDVNKYIDMHISAKRRWKGKPLKIWIKTMREDLRDLEEITDGFVGRMHCTEEENSRSHPRRQRRK